MRFVRYTAGGPPEWGVDCDGSIRRLDGLPGGPPELADLANESYLATVDRQLDRNELPTIDRERVHPLAPVPVPGKIICVGLNYHDHAAEQDEAVPEAPLLFGKAPTAVTNPESPIVHPGGDEQVDYEVELGVVIGAQTRHVKAEAASNYLAGYTIINDVSGRTAQGDDEQFLRGKSYDTFAPMGPALVADRTLDPGALDVRLRVNGETKQSSNTEDLIFSVEELIEYISKHMTLRAGDVISTGTPSGVGIFRDPPDLLEPGDTVEAEIEGIGVLRNHVVAE
jgi:2-keto-4-pentenoate hydratase/2-oxohepta-3-ene-1,7-dioic acid hydratase in catechol pathway